MSTKFEKALNSITELTDPKLKKKLLYNLALRQMPKSHSQEQVQKEIDKLREAEAIKVTLTQTP